jgi:hypothetical protein
MKVSFQSADNLLPKGGTMKRKMGKNRLTGMYCAGMVLAAAQLACTLFSVDVKVGTTPPAEIIALTEKAKATPKAGDTAGAAGQKTPEAAPEGADGGGPVGDFACFTTSMNRITCLSDRGWKTYTQDNTDFYNLRIEDMNACPDGKIYAVTYSAMLVFDGSRWEGIPVAGEEYRGGDSVACGPDGSVWVAGTEGVSQYKNGEWKSFPVEAYASSEYANLVFGLEVAPDGTVWVAAGHSISAYDGTSWKEYKKGSGFDDEVSPAGLAVDSKNRVWTLDYNTLYRFENGEWTAFKLEHGIISVNSLIVDPQDRLWINTSTYGSLILDGTEFKEMSYRSGDIHSNGVNLAAFDQSGRTWLAMKYGVDILAEDSATHYRMDNSDLADNEILLVAVVGAGPALPAEMTKQPGSIVGRITRGGAPLADAAVEFCVEQISFTFTGDTPCSDQPFKKQTKTDAAGKFSVSDMPAGYYFPAVEIGNGWAVLSVVVTDRIFVEAGKETDLGELKVNVE